MVYSFRLIFVSARTNKRHHHQASVVDQRDCRPDQLVQRGESSLSTGSTPREWDDLGSGADSGVSSSIRAPHLWGPLREYRHRTPSAIVDGTAFHAPVSHVPVFAVINIIRGRSRRGRATQVHENMYDNDAGAGTSRALGRQFSGACAGCRWPSWTATRRASRTSVSSAGATHGASCVALEETHRTVR
jgi:hypothetical protein